MVTLQLNIRRAFSIFFCQTFENTSNFKAKWKVQMCSDAICAFLFLVKRSLILIKKIPRDTAVSSYPELECVNTKEELSSGSGAEHPSDECTGYKSITSCWETLLTNYSTSNTSITLV
jgi:hypothetical protein